MSTNFRAIDKKLGCGIDTVFLVSSEFISVCEDLALLKIVTYKISNFWLNITFRSLEED